MEKHVRTYVEPTADTVVLQGNRNLLDVSSNGTESYSDDGSSQDFYYITE